MELLTAVPGPKPLSDADSLPQSLARLEQLLAVVQAHVADVVVSLTLQAALRHLRCPAAGVKRAPAISSSRGAAGGGGLSTHVSVNAPVMLEGDGVWAGAPARPPQAGKKAGDAALGRYLADTLSAVPKFGRAEFERLFNDSVQVSRRSWPAGASFAPSFTSGSRGSAGRGASW